MDNSSFMVVHFWSSIGTIITSTAPPDLFNKQVFCKQLPEKSTTIWQGKLKYNMVGMFGFGFVAAL